MLLCIVTINCARAPIFYNWFHRGQTVDISAKQGDIIAATMAKFDATNINISALDYHCQDLSWLPCSANQLKLVLNNTTNFNF